MKKTLLTLMAAFCSILMFAQVPEGVNYQAVVRDASGIIVSNQMVGMKINIRQSSATGLIVYGETHAPTTNQFGLVNIVVGSGAVISGTFSSINWGAGPYFIEVSVDVTGGTNYVLMGTQQLMSVPYALYAKTSGNGAGPTGPTGAQGVAGTNGTNGATGATGPQGMAGANGAQGATGPTGAQGVAGTNGTNGAAGATGPTGSQGIAGATGTRGATGAQGIQGATGPTGAQGVAGTNGTNGATGPTGNGYTHYIGEAYGGGVIFHLWRDALGAEHGLIVDKTDLSTSQAWSNVSSLTGAWSLWDGLSNSNAIVGQAGHTSSAASLCLNSTNGGQSDWYLPSSQELNILWYNYYTVARSISQIAGAIPLQVGYYWSSSEQNSSNAWIFSFNGGDAITVNTAKYTTFSVRAVRAF
jgi:Protein of unknown function (DUF1566)/Collagen triple helix repeat (20 copies)